METDHELQDVVRCGGERVVLGDDSQGRDGRAVPAKVECDEVEPPKVGVCELGCEETARKSRTSAAEGREGGEGNGP